MSETVTECAECHLTSTLASQFRIGFTKAGKRARLCPVCWRRDQSSNARIRAYWLLGVGVVGLLLPDCPLRWFILGVASGFFLSHALTPLHEASHALTAWLLGFHLSHYKIGWWSEPIFWRQLGRCTIELSSFVEGGMIQAVTPNLRWIQLRQIMVIAAGPGFHVVLVMIAVIVRTRAPLGSWTEWFATVVFLTNGFEFFHNAYPRQVVSPDGEIGGTDGMLIWKWCFAGQDEIRQERLGYIYHECLNLLQTDRNDDAMQMAKTGREEFPDEIILEYLEAYCWLSNRKWDDARLRFEAMRQRVDTQPEWDAFIVTNIVYIDLLSNKPGLLEEALEYSARAYSMLPWNPTIKGPRGAALVASGEIDVGLDLLQQAFREYFEPENKAFHAAFIAWGKHQQGDTVSARRYLDIAKRLDPRAASIERVEAILKQPASASVASA